MRKSKIRKLISEYKNLKAKYDQKGSSQNQKMVDKLQELEHRYFHETGRNITADL